MADPKDTTSFFRKVVKFVANPATEWNDLGPPTPEARENEFAKTELKAMIERKRRNDFVRKREFDMLRKVRREGLSSEQLAALGGSSRLDDSEGRMPESGARADSGVKAKIDEIEQQMVGDGYAGAQRRSPDFYNAPTQPVPMHATAPMVTAPGPLEGGMVVDTSDTPAPGTFSGGLGGPMTGGIPGGFGGDYPAEATVVSPGLAPLPPLSSLSLGQGPADFGRPFAVEVSEVAHDPDLDEAVIAFANADFDVCQQALTTLTAPGASRADHAETWLVLFDLYRAIGQQAKFDALANEYAQRFGWSAPQWFSMPRLVADAAPVEDRPKPPPMDGRIGWVSPARIDADVVARLRSQTLQMPLPWVFDWSALGVIEAEGCARLSELFRLWIDQKLEMRWIGGQHLLDLLQESAPTGVRDVDPIYWQLRLNALRLVNRPDQFDEAAIDYCVTYEVSPPSWEPAACRVRVSQAEHSTQSPPLSVVSEVSTSFPESMPLDDPGGVSVATVDLSGQLVGDIGDLLKKIDGQLHGATIINLSCARLIRVDFIAAGDLLNWVLARRNENRSVNFVDAHRLVALFFGAMGINEHARVRVRTV